MLVNAESDSALCYSRQFWVRLYAKRHSAKFSVNFLNKNWKHGRQFLVDIWEQQQKNLTLRFDSQHWVQHCAVWFSTEFSHNFFFNPPMLISRNPTLRCDIQIQRRVPLCAVSHRGVTYFANISAKKKLFANYFRLFSSGPGWVRFMKKKCQIILWHCSLTK